MAGIDYGERIPNNVSLERQPTAPARARGVAAEVHRLVAEHGPDRLPAEGRLPAHRRERRRAGLGAVRLRQDAGIPLGSVPRRGRGRADDRLRRPPRRPQLAGRAREYRGVLRRLIVTQGDTEPASVEQQRHLGATCPSLYDLRNLFQINVEEGRHLWAMVYLLDAYFGRDGREESEALLQRRSGDRDKPRILGAFNEKTPDWLSYLMFTYFTDRDGKYQLASLAESGFDPLSRTCRFMLTEEAHHLFVGETGIRRVVQRTCELMREGKTDDVRRLGGIDLETLQRYINFHYSVSLDLFGSEISTNAANFYTMGLKGRFEESKKRDDHRLKDATYAVSELAGDRITTREAPALPSLNERLRDDYIADCQRGVDRWNQIIQKHGIGFELRLPNRGFHRAIGLFAEVKVSPDGLVLSEAAWDSNKHAWLPTEADQAYVESLMQPVTEGGRFASWIAPPARGVNGRPIDFEYVRLT